jgi:hypothetical protein
VALTYPCRGCGTKLADRESSCPICSGPVELDAKTASIRKEIRSERFRETLGIALIILGAIVGIGVGSFIEIANSWWIGGSITLGALIAGLALAYLGAPRRR